ncbi:hypothetical protein UUU_35610 [Klebsiella pneumoniae subsp. pneumoniae DSM 30104 = JCM 1662 = NBRC 14940]|nr:hypothetical protein UUU_35610 [Klebsiella pneumoniae subsp. pneumoniae DSM 30104 = JCM 1662 = NBRC 14940]
MKTLFDRLWLLYLLFLIDLNCFYSLEQCFTFLMFDGAKYSF